AEVITLCAVGIFILNGEVIVYVAVDRIDTHLSSPSSGSLDRHLVAHYPSHQIDAVHSLFYDVISGKPVVIIPVAHLILHICPARLSRKGPEFTPVAHGCHRHDFSHRSIEDLSEHSTVGKIVTVAEA